MRYALVRGGWHAMSRGTRRRYGVNSVVSPGEIVDMAIEMCM